MLGTSDVIDDAPHQEGEDMFLSEEEWFGVAIAAVDEETDPRVDLQGPEPIDLPSPNGAAESHDTTIRADCTEWKGCRSCSWARKRGA
jgi:hypothetical protein